MRRFDFAGRAFRLVLETTTTLKKMAPCFLACIDEAYTYLQCAFDPATVREQLHKLKKKFGQEILFHMEFWKGGDSRIIPGALPVVYYTTEARLTK